MTNDNHSLIKAINVSKTYKKDNNEFINVLSSINIEIKLGQSVAIMGASGEGKTTLLHILATLEMSDKFGDIYFQGKNINKLNLNTIRKNFFGFIFQGYNLFDDFTVMDNILIVNKVIKKDTKEIARDKAFDLLQKVNLQDKSKMIVRNLSGGEKQRVAIARALYNDPLLIFADEPSGNLDYETSIQIHDLLINNTKKRKSLIIATHDKELASLCDKVFILKKTFLEKCQL